MASTDSFISSELSQSETDSAPSSLHTITVKTLNGDLFTLTSPHPFDPFSVRYQLQSEFLPDFHPAHFILFSYNDEENDSKDNIYSFDPSCYNDGEIYGLYIRDHIPECKLEFLTIAYDAYRNVKYHKYEFTVFYANSDDILLCEKVYYELDTDYLLPSRLFMVMEQTELEEIVRRYPVYMEACCDMYDMIMEICEPFRILSEFEMRYLAETGLYYFQEIEEEMHQRKLEDEYDEYNERDHTYYKD